MSNVFSYFKKMDWILIGCAVLLSLMGLISIYSSSFFKGDFLNFKKQVLFLAVGFFLMISLSFFDWRIFQGNPYLVLILYFSSVLALSFLYFLGPEIRGVKGWYKFGLFTIDPIEPTKIILIILLAKYFSMRHIELYNIKHIFISGLYISLPSVLIFLQPDLGSVLILIFLWLGILIFSGIKIRHFFILLFVFLFIFLISWNRFLREYQKERIISFIVPQLKLLEIGWSSYQAKIAIGSGGFFGKGFKLGSQTQLGFLTAPQTDFIFSAIAEEFGLFGIAFLLFLIFVLFLKIAKTAFESQRNFPRLFATGFCLLFALQTFVHIGMNLGILPVIGISLPFVSYGGSGLISNYILLGILQSLKIKK